MRGIAHPTVVTEEEALQLFFAGNSHRSLAPSTTAATVPGSGAAGSGQLAAQTHLSSRSHCLFTMYLELRSRIESQQQKKASLITLVDLAGSEKLKGRNTVTALTSSPQRGGNKVVEETALSEKFLREMGNINRSLSYLQQVIVALADKKRDHIPFRSSKLTHFLRQSLGSNCRTVLVTNIRGEEVHKEETLASLRFADRMLRVENDITVRVREDASERVKRMETEIRDLKLELAMHDALTGRGRVSYTGTAGGQTGPLSEERQRER